LIDSQRAGSSGWPRESSSKNTHRPWIDRGRGSSDNLALQERLLLVIWAEWADHLFYKAHHYTVAQCLSESQWTIAILNVFQSFYFESARTSAGLVVKMSTMTKKVRAKEKPRTSEFGGDSKYFLVMSATHILLLEPFRSQHTKILNAKLLTT